MKRGKDRGKAEQFYFMGWRKESTPQPDLHNVSGKL